MSRLTRKHESGEFYLPRRYEDENGNNVVLSNQNCINRLAHYEDLEEQGRLIVQKHGHWKQLDSDFYSNIYFCSNCLTYERVKTVMGKPAYDYCPNCGAKMDEVENERKTD